MTIRPIKTWSHPGALLDALVETRAVVADLEFPIPLGDADDTERMRSHMVEQLDHHLIPRVREEASPAIVVVAGSTGAGKSTVVNALLGEQLTASGVLRPTTRIPHVFHHPLDAEVLSTIAREATVISTEAVPRGLAIIDSPDLDSVRGENRDIAERLLEAADLWIFVTTAARYGDAVPWDALRRGSERGASIAMVLNRVTVDVAAQVRRELVERLTTEDLETLPLFVIPEDTEGGAHLPQDVVGGLGRWLDGVAAASASTIVERTMHGATESLKEWLETLAERMDDQAVAAKEVRAEVRRCAAQAEHAGGDEWYREIATGTLQGRWRAARAEGGPMHKLRHSHWARRRSARELRDAFVSEVRADLLEAVEASLSAAAARASDAMVAALTHGDASPGAWLAAQRDPREARVVRERRAADATRAWLAKVSEHAMSLPGAARGAEMIGEEGVAVALACAALGVDEARGVLGVLVNPTLGDAVHLAQAELTAARRYCINREALDLMKPTDVPSLLPDASSKVRLRRAELRGLL
ncbi:dynamin family protein [Demequina sp. NBRC 110053]|uniref:dynamin family protein n=1 Tax=Demequina sp. NBRC 110053 TaxID=1570342 RepID=UPI000A01D27D|nr:dynamin family protein [Demequina sp. NBRC 110053]